MIDLITGGFAHSPTATVEAQVMFENGDVVQLRGFSEENRISFDEKYIYLHFQGTSSVVEELLEQVRAYLLPNVKLVLTYASNDPAPALAKHFNQNVGALHLHSGDIVSGSIPEVVFAITRGGDK